MQIVEHWKNLSLEDIEGEIWKPISSYEGLYEVSNYSRVKSLERKVRNVYGLYTKPSRILKPRKHNSGYWSILLYDDTKRKYFMLHRLIAIAFIPNSECKPCINHKNGIRTDCRIENLEWCSFSENSFHSYSVLGRESATKGKFGKDNHGSKPILQYDLDGSLIAEYAGLLEAERETGISHGDISMVCNKYSKRNRQTAGGFKWEYK